MKPVPLPALLLLASGAWSAALFGSPTPGNSPESEVIAIGIVLEPDAAMARRATAANGRLRQEYPQGFALDDAHRPHVTLVQRFVRARDVAKIQAALRPIVAAANVTALRLEATGYYYMPDGDLGLAGIVIRPTPALSRLAAQVTDAVAPFAMPDGSGAAFVTPPGQPAVAPWLPAYVAEFVPKHSGGNYRPHLSIGLAPRAFLDRLLAEPFEPFTFSPAGAAVYQLGDYGTATRKLAE